ncbi:hypothetical protein BC835DRAFT_1372894 [Cytidiella melzeri]|nr:hypothetical protein BC835DRAFT_1372894 [Cytidiella melzeri]
MPYRRMFMFIVEQILALFEFFSPPTLSLSRSLLPSSLPCFFRLPRTLEEERRSVGFFTLTLTETKQRLPTLTDRVHSFAMLYQLDLDTVFIVSIWLEAVVFGFLLCLFLASLYINVTLRRHQDGHSKIMFYIGIVMFILSAIHVSMNCYRMIQGYVVHRSDPGGPAAWIGALAPWHHVFKDTIYATQEMLGDAVAIYRTYVIWGRNWKAVLLPSVLLIVGMISGYAVCGLYPSEITGSTVFDPRLLSWISTFYAVSFIQSFLTTTLMAFRIWQTDRRTKRYRADGGGGLFPVVRILVESAALQLLTEFILLVMYAINLNAQYILLEIVTPLVGITFNAITIRIAFRSSETMSNVGRSSEVHPSVTPGIGESTRSHPMQHIKISIKSETEAVADGRSVESFSERK